MLAIAISDSKGQSFMGLSLGDLRIPPALRRRGMLASRRFQRVMSQGNSRRSVLWMALRLNTQLAQSR